MDPFLPLPISRDTVDLEIRCPVQTRVLAILRTFVCSIATYHGFDAEQTDKIEMAVDEACANVIRHAYKHLGVSPDLPEEKQNADPETHRQCVLRLRIHLGEDYLKISIIDHGIGMHNKPPGVNSVEEYTDRGGTGGLGNYIIRNFMDEVEVDFPPESGTILTMTKYRTTAGAKSSN